VSRSPVLVRPAELADVDALREVWQDILRRGSREEQRADLTAIVTETVESLTRAILIAEYEGEVAGAVFLQATTLTPLNLEPAVLAVSPHVVAKFRRKGVGTALIDASVRFAEQHGIGHVVTAANSESRDANRFMARLTLAPQATLRASTTAAVRARLSARRPASGNATATSRQIDRVLAARRSRRERVTG
jgi:predicted N-acetyltransferase YhbS